MARRRGRKAVKKSLCPPTENENGGEERESEVEKQVPWPTDQDVERQTAAIRALRDVEIERLLTELRLLRAYFSQEQLQTPLLQFAKENLPNISIVKSGSKGGFEMQWLDKDDNLSKKLAKGIDVHASLLHRLSIAYPGCSSAMPDLSGFELSTKSVKTSHLGAHNLQIRDFALEEPTDTLMLGIPDVLQTPGVSSQRMSIGMTPKTLRLPKPGEMLLSVHGSPLGVYKEDNLEAIHESEEG